MSVVDIHSHILPDRVKAGDVLTLADRGLIACTATDTHDAVRRVPQSIWNEWGMSLLKGGS